MNNENLIKALYVAGKLMAESITKEIIKAKKKATGNLARSITFKVNPKTLSIEIMGPDYLTWVDQGRKPGKQPPVDKLIPWVRIKRLKFGKTDKQTAFIIARSIGKKGIKPTNVIRKGKLAVSKQVSKIVAKGAALDAMDRVRDSFNKI